MNKKIKDRLEEIQFREGQAIRVAKDICDVIMKYNLSLNQADVTLDLAKDMLANKPLNTVATVITELKQRNGKLLSEVAVNDKQIKINQAVIDMLTGNKNKQLESDDF